MNEELKQNVIKGLGLELLTPDQQEDALDKIGRLIYQGTLERALERLSDSDLDEFEKNFSGDNADPEAVMRFLKDKIPDLDRLTEEEVKDFRDKTADFLSKISNTAQ
ncbi:MAG TPA: hypothetical protein VMU70_01670 [Candidatus Tyrphobacter sp.]|nr:hypothetical protein [Candidatus Tyrphobacter sp.]